MIKENIYCFLLKKNNIDLNEDETYKLIVDKILKNNIDCYTKFIKDHCRDRVLNKKPQSKICFHPPCFKRVENDNYCSNHQDKKNL